MRKSYNPFKMWGSYVGAIVGIIASFVPSIIPITSPENILLTDFWIVLPILAVIGFLVGYGIHALVRVIKN